MLKVSVLVWIMLGTVLAGAAMMVVILTPGLSGGEMKNIPIAVLIGFIVAMPLSYMVAKQISAAERH